MRLFPALLCGTFLFIPDPVSKLWITVLSGGICAAFILVGNESTPLLLFASDGCGFTVGREAWNTPSGDAWAAAAIRPAGPGLQACGRSISTPCLAGIPGVFTGDSRGVVTGTVATFKPLLALLSIPAAVPDISRAFLASGQEKYGQRDQEDFYGRSHTLPMVLSQHAYSSGT